MKFITLYYCSAINTLIVGIVDKLNFCGIFINLLSCNKNVIKRIIIISFANVNSFLNDILFLPQYWHDLSYNWHQCENVFNKSFR